MAMILVGVRQAAGTLRVWWLRIFAIVMCLPLLLALYLSQSLGAWFAIAVAGLFILAASIGNRKVLLIGGLVLVGAMVVGFVLFGRPILEFIVGRHESVKGISTLTKRIYLWESALRMIHDRPWFGFGMENWLCYYSYNTVCHIPAKIQPFHYWIITNPVTKAPTGLTDEPTLSHPHNIFLHVWVSMGVFGLLAFVAVLVLFFWLFVRVLTKLRSAEVEGGVHLQWMTIGVGGAMLAALVQGLVDSSFLVQDLAFCFWMLVAALLVLRVLSGTSWRGRPTP
jgi:O-antigen ligase